MNTVARSRPSGFLMIAAMDLVPRLLGFRRTFSMGVLSSPVPGSIERIANGQRRRLGSGRMKGWRSVMANAR